MQIERIRADLDVNHHKWRAEYGALTRYIVGERNSSSSHRLDIMESGNLQLRFEGDHNLTHRLRLGFIKRLVMRRWVAAWKKRLTDQAFAKLGVPDEPSDQATPATK